MLGEPLDGVRSRRVESEHSVFEEQDTIRMRQGASHALLGQDDSRAQCIDGVEKGGGAVGVELRGRLVEEEKLRLECEGRGETDALELSAGELDSASLGQVRRADRFERAIDPSPDRSWLDADVLQPERDFVRDDRHHDLVLRILEHGGHGSRHLSRSDMTGVKTGDHDAALEPPTVEVRHEAGQRPQERRLPGTRWPEQRHALPGVELQRDAAQRCDGGRVGERQPLDDG